MNSIHTIIAQMSVLSEHPAACLDSVRVHGGEKEQKPRGPRQSLAEEWAAAYERAGGPVSRQTVAHNAAGALKLARVKPVPVVDKDPEPEKGSPQWKHWIAAHPMARKEPGRLGTIQGVSRQYIRKLVDQYGPSDRPV